MHQAKRKVGWITSWNQNCGQKYQQPLMCRQYHCNGRKWRITKELLDGVETGKWKSWLETQHSKNWDHSIWSHHFMVNIRVKTGSSDRFLPTHLGRQYHCGQWLQPWNQKTIVSCQESYEKPRQCVEKQRHYSANKGPYSQSCAIPSGPVRLWELDHEEGRRPKNWCLL